MAGLFVVNTEQRIEMDLTNIEAVIEEHGIPFTDQDIIRIAREARGLDATSLIAPPRNTNRNAFGGNRNSVHVPGPWIAHNIVDAYAAYRADRNWAQLNYSHQSGIVSIYRRSSPTGPIGHRASNANYYIGRWLNSWATQRGIADERNILVMPAPVVIDQNTRVDYEPRLIGDTDHIRIQAVMTTSPPATLAASVQLNHFTGNSTVYEPAITEEQFRANGWIPIFDSTGLYLIGAKLPEDIDPHGRQLILVGFERRGGNYLNTSRLITELLMDISGRWSSSPAATETEQPTGPTEEDRQFVSRLQLVRTLASTVNDRIQGLEALVASNRLNVQTYTTHLANSMRSLADTTTELELFRNNMSGQVIERVRAMSGLADQVSAMRGVESAEMDMSESNVALKFVTNFFGMTRNSEQPMLIPRVTYEIDLTATSFDRGIKITCSDRDYKGDGNIHPHLGIYENRDDSPYSVCWGNAGREPLPDAWARRDWISLIRLILSFHTQYNANSPLTTYSYVRDNLNVASRTGWITHQEVLEGSVSTNNNQSTVDLVGAASEPAPF